MNASITIKFILFHFYFYARINEWARKQIHSHNYRHPQPFQDQVFIKFD